jgi:hypothetical protein
VAHPLLACRINNRVDAWRGPGGTAPRLKSNSPLHAPTTGIHGWFWQNKEKRGRHPLDAGASSRKPHDKTTIEKEVSKPAAERSPQLLWAI